MSWFHAWIPCLCKTEVVSSGFGLNMTGRDIQGPAPDFPISCIAHAYAAAFSSAPSMTLCLSCQKALFRRSVRYIPTGMSRHTHKNKNVPEDLDSSRCKSGSLWLCVPISIVLEVSSVLKYKPRSSNKPIALFQIEFGDVLKYQCQSLRKGYSESIVKKRVRRDDSSAWASKVPCTSFSFPLTVNQRKDCNTLCLWRVSAIVLSHKLCHFIFPTSILGIWDVPYLSMELKAKLIELHTTAKHDSHVQHDSRECCKGRTNLTWLWTSKGKEHGR